MEWISVGIIILTGIICYMLLNLRTIAPAVVVALTGIFFSLLWFHQMEYGTERNVKFTVQSLDDQASGRNGHKYLIFTTDGRVFENTDAWFHGKTDSSDIWAKFLEAGDGATWNCPVYGYRETVISSYQDILDGCHLLHKGTPISAVG